MLTLNFRRPGYAIFTCIPPAAQHGISVQMTQISLT